MKSCLLTTLGQLLSLCPSPGADTSAPPAANWRLWYDQPANTWVEALPLGNGHLGAMVFGGIPNEHLQFNEYTIWTGHPLLCPPRCGGQTARTPPTPVRWQTTRRRRPGHQGVHERTAPPDGLSAVRRFEPMDQEAPHSPLN